MAPNTTLMVGETDKIQFVSHNKDKPDPGYNCEFVNGFGKMY